MSETELVVSAGAVIALRLFDVAYAIDLARAEALWAAQARASSRLRLTATPPKAMAFGVPPLALALDPVTLDLDGQARAGRRDRAAVRLRRDLHRPARAGRRRRAGPASSSG